MSFRFCACSALLAVPLQLLIVGICFAIDKFVQIIDTQEALATAKLAAALSTRREGARTKVTPEARLFNAVFIVLDLNFVFVQIAVWRSRSCTAQVRWNDVVRGVQ